MPRRCIPLAGGGFACGNFPTRVICDVCDGPVPARKPKIYWRGNGIDLCAGCESRYFAEPEFAVFADKLIARFYPEKANAK